MDLFELLETDLQNNTFQYFPMAQDHIRRLAADKHRKADAGAISQDPQKAGDKRPM
ncbi:hypothetical protein [Mesorhizobium tamadayense]|uniref:hypothetical protein n=1 Tax=Mesorhizobium tamadayense TaxID=425306 RepID=UPI00142DA583|nr:hypothetical protein [Mesorhizobium tamadayense]